MALHNILVLFSKTKKFEKFEIMVSQNMRHLLLLVGWSTGLSSQTSRVVGPAMRASPASKAEPVASALRSVCKIYVTVVEPDYAQPWSVFPEDEAVGSGFIVEDAGKALRVMTNAHVVRWGTDIRVRRHGDTKRYKARTIGVSHESDLALLAIDDVDFWRADDGTVIRPLNWASLPSLYDDVAVVGYPMGGDNVCVTRGVVSRVDTMSYARGAPALLVVQIDAAVNSGNSGGPALDADGSVVGVAFSGYAGSADNIGYIIPESVARTFLDECEAGRRRNRKGKMDGTTVTRVELCALGVSAQPVENEALRSYLQLGDKSGVLVTRVAESSCAKSILRPGDVLLSVGGAEIADDGTIELRTDERVDLAHAATSRRAGESVTLRFARDGAIESADVTFAPLPRLVPIADDDQPSYLVLAGIVLMRLTLPLLEAESSKHHSIEDDRDGENPRLLALHADSIGLEKSSGGPSELVVWTTTLTTDANFGYAHLCDDLPVLKAVCGVPITSLAHVAQVIDDADASRDDFYTLDFEPPNARPGDVIKVVLDADQVHKANDDVLRRRFLPSLASNDVVEALELHRLKQDPSTGGTQASSTRKQSSTQKNSNNNKSSPSRTYASGQQQRGRRR